MIGVGQTLGIFQAKLGLDTQDYAKGAITATAMNRVFGESFSTFVANPLLGSIQILKNVGTAFAGAAARQLEYAETVQRMSQATGASEQFLVALEKRLEVAGKSAERGAQGLKAYSQRLIDLQNNTGPLKELTDRFNEQIDTSGPLERSIGQVLDIIGRLPSAYERSAYAARIFGEEAGPDLLNAIGGGTTAISRMEDEARKLGFRLDRVSNDSLANANTQLGYMKLAVEGIRFNAINSFLTGITGETTEGVDGILGMANSINNELTPAVTRLGRELRPLLRESAEALPGIASSLTDVVSGLSGIAEVWEGSWAQDLRRLAVDLQAVGLHDILFSDNYSSPTSRNTTRQFRQMGYEPGWTPWVLDYVNPYTGSSW